MNNETGKKFNDMSLAIRVKDGYIKISEMQSRAYDIWQDDSLKKLIYNNGMYYCPICYSNLPEWYLLVREKGFYACDYCIPFMDR